MSNLESNYPVVADFATSEIVPCVECENSFETYTRLIDYCPTDHEQKQVRKMLKQGYKDLTINAYLLQCKYQKLFDAEGEILKAFINDYKRLAQDPFNIMAEQFKDKAQDSPDRNAYSHFHASFMNTYYKYLYDLEQLRSVIRSVVYDPVSNLLSITKLLNL